MKVLRSVAGVDAGAGVSSAARRAHHCGGFVPQGFGAGVKTTVCPARDQEGVLNDAAEAG
ncbi:hypothetical protein GCM10022214_50540 [Actinomadura miaoliensis]|uniref:Uncharacterized protein n=1 Tax=Actinomadura miaoliensis TaxID=430685 RepID=A0ABP7WAF5_9ACTN